MTHSEIARADGIRGSHAFFCKQLQSYRHQSTRQHSVGHPLEEDTIKTHHTVMRCVAPGKEQHGDQQKDQFATSLDLYEQ